MAEAAYSACLEAQDAGETPEDVTRILRTFLEARKILLADLEELEAL